MIRKERIYDCLIKNLSPQHLEVIDDSHLHIGHQGASPLGETHYRIIIKASDLPLNRVQRERAVTQLLSTEFETGLHALQIKFI